MALNANALPRKASGKQQPNLEPGGYPARVVQLIDLGLQAQRPYQGQEKGPAYEIMLTYELVDEFMKDDDDEPIKDKPRWVSETFPLHPLVADKAKSTKRYLALDPSQAFKGDFSKLIDTPCTVTIVNNKGADGRVYDNIGNVSTMRPREAVNCPPLVNPTKVFDLDAPNMEVFNSLPEWLREKIKGNLNFQGSKLQAALDGNVPKQDKPAPRKEAPADDNPY